MDRYHRLKLRLQQSKTRMSFMVSFFFFFNKKHSWGCEDLPTSNEDWLSYKRHEILCQLKAMELLSCSQDFFLPMCKDRAGSWNKPGSQLRLWKVSDTQWKYVLLTIATMKKPHNTICVQYLFIVKATNLFLTCGKDLHLSVLPVSGSAIR